MRKLIKSLFLPLAVFAMLGLGALTLSASNVINEVVTKTEAASMQSVYTGDFYVVDATQTSGYRQVSITPNHCTLTPTLKGFCMENIGGVLVQIFGEQEVDGILEYKPLYEI